MKPSLSFIGRCTAVVVLAALAVSACGDSGAGGVASQLDGTSPTVSALTTSGPVESTPPATDATGAAVSTSTASSTGAASTVVPGGVSTTAAGSGATTTLKPGSTTLPGTTVPATSAPTPTTSKPVSTTVPPTVAPTAPPTTKPSTKPGEVRKSCTADGPVTSVKVPAGATLFLTVRSTTEQEFHVHGYDLLGTGPVWTFVLTADPKFDGAIVESHTTQKPICTIDVT